jgi:hypothetical protein
MQRRYLNGERTTESHQHRLGKRQFGKDRHHRGSLKDRQKGKHKSSFPRIERAMCSIDWTALGSCVGALAVSIGVVVAWIQLKSINANERIKATVEYLAQYGATDAEGLNAGPSTPAMAVSILNAIMSTPETIRVYRALVKAFYDGTLHKQLGKEASAEMGRQAAAVVVAANYFSVPASLIARGRLDKELFYESLAKRVDDLWRFAQAFRDVDPGARAAFEDLQLRKFAQDATAWYQKHAHKFWDVSSSQT